MEGVNVCACTSHMTLGINARVPQHGITGLNCRHLTLKFRYTFLIFWSLSSKKAYRCKSKLWELFARKN
ncbi:hypothetical protein BpHYR1_048621 [Brachionus plicatilis]|uniref:Uncharacterized protein n=1 Tax=Brachionus plicatilis TaxID=10195 RepID=A0A3M7RLQ0_BRAPC|nr:hypothetical protein BpHYR1_048621 [Brachionus plicatilis]